MSKQSDQEMLLWVRGAYRNVRKLCVLGGLHYIYSGSAFYSDYTDWK